MDLSNDEIRKINTWQDVIKVSCEKKGVPEKAEDLINKILEVQREEKKKERKLKKSMMTEEEIQAEKLKTKERNLKKKDKRLEWRKNNKDKIKEYNATYYKKIKKEE